MAHGWAVPLLGRDEDTRDLRAAFDEASHGHSRTVFLRGPAGIGKSRLAQEFLATLPAPTIRLAGFCTAVGGAQYLPLFGALHQLAGQVGAERAAELLDGAPILAGALGFGSGPVGGAGLDAEHRQRFLGDALRLLGAVAAGAPTVVLVEDLHWADPDTLGLIGFLARSLLHERVLLVGTLRDDQFRRHPMRSVVTDLLRDGRVRALDLRPLVRDEVRALALATGNDVDDDAVAELLARGEGNPFFTEQLLAAEGGEVPAAVEDLLLSQVDALPESVQRVLRVVAASGRTADAGLVEAVAGLDEGLLDDALRAAVEARFLLIDDEGGLTFRHALLAEAVAGTLLPGERRRLHRRIAEVLSSDPAFARMATPAELTHHWRRAGESAHALAAAIKAADAAVAHHAVGSAYEHLITVLELWDEVPAAETGAGRDRHSVQLWAAEVASLAGRRGEGARLARAAARTDDRGRRAEALARLALCLYADGHLTDALTTVDDALALIADLPAALPAARVLVVWAGTSVVASRFAEVLERAAEVGQVVERAGDPDLTVGWLHAEGTCRAGLLDWGGVALLRRAIEVALDAGLVDRARISLHNLATILAVLEPPATVLATVDEYVALINRHESQRLAGGRAHTTLDHPMRSELLFLLGRLDELSRTLAGIPRDLRWFESFSFGLARTSLALELDDAAGARRRLSMPDLAAAGSYRLGEVRMAELEAAVSLAEGDPVRALDVVATAIRTAAGPAVLLHGPPAVATALEAAAAIGASAREAATELHAVSAGVLAKLYGIGGRPLTHQAWHDVATAHLAGLSGDASDQWRTAVAALDNAEMTVHAGWSRRHLAAALLAAGDRDGAAAALKAAAEVAAQRGATRLARAVDDLRRRGRLGAAATVDPAAGLTEREREVLRLVVEGLTNAEIGQRLFISAKTASVHISNVMRKLTVTNRRQAARAARELGLLAGDMAPEGSAHRRP